MKNNIYLVSSINNNKLLNQVPSGKLSGILDDNSQEVLMTKDINEKISRGNLWK